MVSLNDKYTGYGYKNPEELEDNEFYFQDKFHFNSEMIFNKFFICQFQNIEFSNYVFLIESISLNSLILKDLNSNKILEFTKYDFPIIVSKPNYANQRLKIDADYQYSMSLFFSDF